MNSSNSSSGSLHGTCFSARCLFTLAEKIGIVIAFFAVVIVSLIGNIMVCYVVISKKRLRSIASLSTINLALSDLLITICCAPVTTIDLYIASHWVFGKALCKAIPVVQKMSVIASMINLLVISVERFLAVRFPFFFRTRKKWVVYYMPAVWLVAVGISAPSSQYKHYLTIAGSSYCFSFFPDIQTATIITVINALAFFVPLTMILVIQLLTIYGLSRKIPQRSNHSANQQTIRRQKAAKVLLIVMLSFLVLWSPIYTLSMLHHFSDVLAALDYMDLNIIFAVFTWLFYLCAAMHPIIFFLLTPQGKQSFKDKMKREPTFESKVRLVSRPLSTSTARAGSSMILRESTV